MGCCCGTFEESPITTDPDNGYIAKCSVQLHNSISSASLITFTKVFKPGEEYLG